MKKNTYALMIVLLLVTACGSEKSPTQTPIPPTITPPPSTTSPPPTPSPTDTPQPPTATPTDRPPAPTATPIPPTATPTPATAGSQVINAETVDRLEKVATFDLPDSFVNTIIFSPDGRTLITGDRNGEVLLWDCETWEKTTYLPARSTRAADSAAQIWFWSTLALSPDGNVIVTAYGDDGEVIGRDRQGQELFAFSYGTRVYSLEISPDGQFLAVGGLNNNILIFDLETQQLAADLVSDYERALIMVFSSDGKTLLVNYHQPEHVFTVWDTATWQQADTFSLPAAPGEYLDYHDVLFSPDGQQLVVASTERVEIKFLDLATKQIVREFSAHTRAPYQMAFSPDGSLLASASDDGSLRLWDMKTGVNVKTTRNIGGEAGAVAFSPDGTLIAFSLWGQGVQVWAVTPSTVTPEPPASPTAPPTTGSDEGVIAFYSNRDGNPEIYVMNADGSDLRRLTDNDATDQAPAWSPDGTKIAFVSDRDGNREIYVMNADGSEPQRLTDNPAYESHPAWSHDGTQIAFISERDGNREIYTMDADGSNVQRLTNDDAEDMRPNWSPDGKQIAFNSYRDGNWEIYVVDSAGGNLHRLTDSPAWEIFPAWSPDGTKIAYRHSVAQAWNGDVWVIKADGSDKQQLTDHSGNDENPAWSPDGTQIVFQSDRYAESRSADTYNFEILVMDADGNNQRRLTDNPAGDYWPSWGSLAVETPTQIPTKAPTDQPTTLPTLDDLPAIASLHDTWTRPTDEMVMIYVPGGTFQMGSDTGDTEANDDEFPQHPVTLDGFWIDRTEVTNAQYALCVADGDCDRAPYTDDANFNGDDYPVTGISWEAAADYCAWARARLPTEAEWEYAARGTQGSIYPWGDDFDCSRGNFDGEGCDGYVRTAPVGKFPTGASWCGALDMAGNVWEWAADWDSAYPSEPQTNPTGPDEGTRKIFRGGSFNYGSSYARTADRGRHYPDGRSGYGGYVGFRCAGAAATLDGRGGGVIAFDSERDGDPEIYVMNADGSDLRQLTNNRFEDSHPSWSPDGSQIAFESDRNGAFDIYAMSSDGTNQQRLTQHPAIDAGADWSPDGSQIAFVSLRDGNAEIYVMNFVDAPRSEGIDGSDPRRLTENPAGDYEPDWSPDGAHIAFSSSRQSEFANIYVINVADALRSEGAPNEDLRQLTDTQAHDVYPDWSPDGTQIAFVSRRDGNWEIYVMNSDGSDPRRLTHNNAFDGGPRWSPDGKHIVFESDRDGSSEIYVMNVEEALQSQGANDAHARRLTFHNARARRPVWRLVSTPN